MLELPISESDAYAISKSQLELDSLLTIDTGRQQLRDEIIFDIWKDFFKVLQKYRCVSSDECQECIKTMKSFLIIMNEKESFSQFVQSFTKLSFTARISGNLKIGLVQFLADLVPHYNLIKYVMDSKRQNHEYLRNMEIYWPHNIDSLNNSITRSEYNKKLEINELKMSKEQKLKEMESEFKSKQMKMSEEIKIEIREELKLHEGKEISIPEISQITEKITKAKLKLFETEIADYLEKLKLSYDLELQIVKKQKL